MGFFDAIKKVIGGAEQLKTQLDAMQTKAIPKESNPTTVSQQKNSTAPELLKTGDIPAKPSVLRETYGYRDDENADYNVTFMLSGDFVEFKSHCEDDPAFLYEPNNDEEYTHYQENHPCIYISGNNSVYDAIESYRNTGTACKDFEKLYHEKFLFKARTDYFGNVLWIYAFSEQSSQDGFALCLDYAPDIVGTSLEKKLIAALDEAVATYTETKSNES